MIQKENLKIIVTRQGEKKIGVIVDSVSEVKPIMEDQIEDAPRYCFSSF